MQEVWARCYEISGKVSHKRVNYSFFAHAVNLRLLKARGLSSSSRKRGLCRRVSSVRRRYPRRLISIYTLICHSKKGKAGDVSTGRGFKSHRHHSKLKKKNVKLLNALWFSKQFLNSSTVRSASMIMVRNIPFPRGLCAEQLSWSHFSCNQIMRYIFLYLKGA